MSAILLDRLATRRLHGDKGIAVVLTNERCQG